MRAYYSSGSHGRLGVGNVLYFICVAKLICMENIAHHDVIADHRNSQVTRYAHVKS
jgi:hypothetical protein